MKTRRTIRMGMWTKVFLACFALGAFAFEASAQGGGGGGGAGGGGGGAGGGGGKAGGASGSPGGGSGLGGGGGGSSGSSSVFGSGGTGTTGKGSGGGTQVGKNTFLGPYYASPMAAGLGANVTLSPSNGMSFDTGGAKSNTLVTGRGTFGTPMYAATSTGGTGKGGAGGGGAGGGTGTSSGTSMGFTTIGTKRTPQYYTVPEFKAPPKVAVVDQLPLFNSSIKSSTPFQGDSSINVSVNKDVVILNGTVASEKDRRVAEGMVRMEPGVREVQNNLVVDPSLDKK